ncbi:ornithine decarboxylase 1-like [Cylas formicarius]|uniref:ornithine decarboxylase 1-like n=1 Tax=Cylas formicarius TaxID=197179 RepID=UPI0029585233|nr:ornithine decarboxylase 1-like [Cylas formicarius]
MKIANVEDRIHILEPTTDTWSVIRDIASDHNQEEAFYVCDIVDVVKKYGIWRSKLPRVQPYYAVKCNDNLTILEILSTLGANFDCASKSEINKVLSLGVGPDRIIFANPAKPASHIRHAESVGVSIMTFDNETELHKIKKLYTNAKLVIRILCEASDAQCPLGMKFGCDPVNDAPILLDVAKSLDLDVVGVSFHVGSGCREATVYRRAIATAREVFDYAASLGFNFYLLDIGGGYPGDRGTSIDKIANIVNMALDDFFPDPRVQVIAEPGRFFVSSAYTLACNIHSIRDSIQKDDVTKSGKLHKMYYINDGVYGSFNCILYDHQVVAPQPLYNNQCAKYYSSSIWGPTCDGLDQVVLDVQLPEMKVGDWIVFENMGAYTLPVASEFNGFPIPKVHFVIDEATWNLLKTSLSLSEDNFEILDRPAFPNDINTGNALFDVRDLPLRIDLPLYGQNVNYIDVAVLE